MIEKTFKFKMLKLSRMIVGVLCFFVAGVSVFAKCSDYSSYDMASKCASQTEDGFKCVYGGSSNYDRKCKKSTECATGYVKSGNSCVKNSNNSRKQYWYNCGGTCKKLYNYEKEQKGSACSDTKYTTEAKCESAVSNNSRKQYWYNCSGVCKQLYNYEKEQKGSACSNTKYTTEAKCKSSISSSSSSKNNTSNSSSNSSSSNSNSTTTSYRILFDQNYGYGLECDSGYNVPSAGICSKYVSKGTTASFPKSSSNMYREGQGLLLGWTKTVSNGAPNCNVDVVEKDLSETFTVNSNIDYYACYREDIGGWRYLAKDYVADGGAANYSCGQRIFIEYCNKESSGDYCYYYENSTGTYRKVYRDKLTISEESAKSSCDDMSVSDDVETINKYRYATISADDYLCGEALYITTCVDNVCSYNKVSKFSGSEITSDGTVDRTKLVESSEVSKSACESIVAGDDSTSEDSDEKCVNEQKNAMTGTASYTICYNEDDTNDEIKTNLQKYFLCNEGAGYSFDETSVKSISDASCKNGICTRTYSLSCTLGEKARPTLVVTSGVVGSDGKGTITVSAFSKEGEIVGYYTSEKYLTPTSTSDWISLKGSTFKITDTPGIKYIWVIDSKGNISYAVSGAILDTVNNDTTIKKLELYDENGNIQTPSRVSYSENTVKSSKYVMLSSELDKDSEVIADGFNPYDMEYKLEVSSPTVSVYATLTSTDSKYVDGYEPRTVNLDYGVNTVLIKIQNKEGKIRTYTILVTRTDDRTSDNTLSNLSLSVGNINFNSNVTDYKVEIPKSTTSVDVSSQIASDKASYVSGYEPGTVQITGDTTVKLIKVKSQTGSTRTYVITFVKEGTDVISKDSLKLSDLVIPGVYVAFEENVANYSLSVDYETDVIDINTVLKDSDSIVSISEKKKSDSEYKSVSKDGIGLDVGENFIEVRVIDIDNEESYYRLTIIRKEFGLGISDDTTLKDLKVLGYNIKFDPAKKEYSVRIKQEKSLVITAVPNSNRAEVFIRGNEELTGFSTVRVKVVAENGKYDTYSIDIKKDAFNKTIEIASIVAGAVIILISSGIIIVKKKAKAKKEYFEE